MREVYVPDVELQRPSGLGFRHPALEVSLLGSRQAVLLSDGTADIIAGGAVLCWRVSKEVE